MSRPEVADEDKIIETWEINTPGTVWVMQFDRREDRYKKTRIGGRSGTRRLYITRDDRKFNQEQIPLENQHLDPFTNGALVLIDAANRDETLDQRYHLNNEALSQYFAISDEDLFREEMESITSELVIRRLAHLGEKEAKQWQSDIIRDIIERKYKAGGTQRTVRELLSAGEQLGLTAL